MPANPLRVEGRPDSMLACSPRADSMRVVLRAEMDALGGTSVLASICLLVQAVVGGGLLMYPHAYMTGGIINIVITQGLMLAFIAPGLWILAVCTERTGATTYQSLMKRLLGRRAEVFCEILIVVLIFGASVTYLDIFVDQIHPWLVQADQNCGTHQSDVLSLCWLAKLLAARGKLTALVALLLSLLCLGRTMASLSIPSLVGFGALLYVCFIIIANYMLDPHPPSSSSDSPVWLRTELRDWSSMIPVICFSYQGHISAVPMYAELRRRSMRRWLVVISFGLSACVLLYNATGLLGYLTFLSSTQSDVLKCFVSPGYKSNVPEMLVSLARIAIAMAVAVTSAVFTFCARSAIVDEVNNMWRGPDAGPLPYSAFLFITYAWVALVALVAICFPDIGIVVSFVGNICAFFMFHFPGLCLIAIAEDCESYSYDDGPQQRGLLAASGIPSSKRRMSIFAGWAFVLVGTLVFCFGMYNAIQSVS
eukprot:gb/GFBE01071405.1/.p1 GENE.gb/GFBE01071405.1/~~gb/GFBE01071405.1/.p1  ORF type:complete len:479 (+),score=59.26 gb/GFBE01071405.1/:1-1437(+)